MQPSRPVLLIAAVILIAVAGCGSDEPAAAPTPSRTAPAGSASAGGAGSSGPAGSPSPPTLIEFTVDGAGPYQLGASLDSLRAMLDEVKSGEAPCAQNTTARGTGTWRDVYLSFRADGVLYLMINRSPSIPTPSGAWLGTPLAQLKKIYANVARQDLTNGSHHAFLVTTLSGRGILFDLDLKTAVTAMYAAEASYLRDAFAAGAFC